MLTTGQLLTRRQLAEQLGFSPRTLDRWCREGLYGIRLRKRRVGGKVGFDATDVDAWQRAVEAASNPEPAGPRKRRGKGGTNEEAKQRLRDAGLL